jgi:hypothetical protein
LSSSVAQVKIYFQIERSRVDFPFKKLFCRISVFLILASKTGFIITAMNLRFGKNPFRIIFSHAEGSPSLFSEMAGCLTSGYSLTASGRENLFFQQCPG